MATPSVIIGDDWNTTVTISTKNLTTNATTPFDASGATSVKAVICEKDGATAYTEEVTLTDTGEADWANGVVAVQFSSAQTSALSTYFTAKGFARLEIMVDKAGVESTWKEAGSLLKIIPGTIA